MKSFKEYLTEKQQVGKMEIDTLKGKEHGKAIRAMGIEVEMADDEGMIVVPKNTSEMKKVHNYMMKNGWDKEDIKAMHS